MSRFDGSIAANLALAGMDDSLLSALSPVDMARYQTDAARAAMAGAAVVGEINAVAERCVEERIAMLC